ncbi:MULTISPECIES: S8 family serine peptidase [unclassified Streptomyces]|uniref:S8 family serine peptidase n=1 Tax=unclassified Streptomyces TaxID=2593676 RepID=UPI000DB95362|nr:MULTISPECIES: S8 family serine peptidase [unclassified Streptomyces]MYT72861.1 S8 family serine peptidase [Streptomyces sp. SID8367]RAJ78837.1 carboxypeptidase family protein [Streptomyces sp. PsTaAH-137]
MHLPRPPRRRTAVWAAAAFTATALTAGVIPAVAADTPSAAATAKIDPSLSSAVAEGGDATFFVVLKDRADLSAAKKQKTHAAKAKAAFKELRAKAADTQAPLTSFLDKKKVGHKDYWIANAVQVTGGERLVNELAKRPDVASVVKEQHYKLDDIETADSKVTSSRTDSSANGDDTPEWGVSDINADDVWNQYDDRGEGIVIANVDSGVQYDHPDLVAQYRGNNGDGTFTHDYNFYDPTGQCGTGGVPCDNNGHGTHTMGTMVGRHGIGVAPNAKWIAAKGCESSSCSDESLLAAGQWILAPTDHNGQNPRPDLAPNIVNNSWGGGDTTFYQDIVEAWNSAGIFEAFAAGNDGDGKTCSTAHAPGSQAPSYGVGAYDSSGTIASFSGFGPSLVDGSAKPNISAPGVNVQSTWPGSAYNTESGTSMATPHVAGAVALLWSAAPSLIGKIDETRALLNEGARDVDDTHCGGTAGMNNVWGEGRLDILASVDKAPHTAAVVTGEVTDKATGTALSGVTVKAEGAGTTRTVTTGTDGSYRLPLPAGTYTFTFGGYGYANGSAAGVTLTDNQAFTQDIALTPVASHQVSGTVADVTGKPLPGAKVELTGTPLDAVTTNAKGRYSFAKVAEGSYSLTVKPAAPVLCNGVYTGSATVGADGLAKNVQVPNRTDNASNSCAPAAYSWIAGTKKVALTGDEDAATVALPFPVKLYGVPYSSASVTTDGLINFLSSRVGDYSNTALPTTGVNGVKGIVAPLWDDLTLDKKSSVQTATTGTKGSRTFAVVWNNAAYANGTSGRATFEAVFDEATGAVTLQYRSVADRGAGATVGIADQNGTDALQYAYNQSVLTDGTAVRFVQGAK